MARDYDYVRSIDADERPPDFRRIVQALSTVELEDEVALARGGEAYQEAVHEELQLRRRGS